MATLPKKLTTAGVLSNLKTFYGRDFQGPKKSIEQFVAWYNKGGKEVDYLQTRMKTMYSKIGGNKTKKRKGRKTKRKRTRSKRGGDGGIVLAVVGITFFFFFCTTCAYADGARDPRLE